MTLDILQELLTDPVEKDTPIMTKCERMVEVESGEWAPMKQIVSYCDYDMEKVILSVSGNKSDREQSGLQNWKVLSPRNFSTT